MTALAEAVAKLSPETRATLLARIGTNLAKHRFDRMYPDTGELRRELYPTHARFFAAGAEHQERAFVAGNRTGKSSCLAYELAAHALGKYPDWWVGRRFARPVTCWAVAVDSKSARDTIQTQLLGSPEAPGTGMIPPSAIVSTTRRSGVAEAVDSIVVKHVTGGHSRITIKSAEQGREAMQGARCDVIWMDEEMPIGVYSECCLRTMAVTPGERNGLVMLSFTPLSGLTDVVLLYLPGGKPP